VLGRPRRTGGRARRLPGGRRATARHDARGGAIDAAAKRIVGALGPDELERAVDEHWATADPRNQPGDHVWWNWCRMPAATSARVESPATVAVIPAVVAHLQEWLDRDREAAAAGVSVLDALSAGLPGKGVRVDP
jgi:hypothetical protein